MSFSLSKYQLLEKIGVGSYGEVFTIKDKRTDQIYVAKISTNRKNISKEKLNEEIEKISKLKSDPCISKFIGFSPEDFKKKDNPVIVNEFISNDTLRKLLNLELAGSAPRAWDINKKLINVFGIASGMRELHSKGIVHGNLKPENILLDSYLYPKVCDYGISKTISTSSFSSSNSNEWFIYLSPEIVDGEGPSEKGDVYAFAFIAYEIMTGKKPFENLTMRQIMNEIAKGKRPSFKDVKPTPSAAFVVLMSHCWNKDPQKRLSFDEIIKKLKNPKLLKVLTDDTEYQNYIKYVESKSSKPNPEPPKISLYTESEELQEESESDNSDVSDDSDKNDDDDNDEEYPKDRICPKEIFDKLTEENKEFIKTADGNDKEAQYEVGITFVEQKRKIPYNSRNRIIGFQYLLKSLENGKEESGIYYYRHCKSQQETKLGTKFVGSHSDSNNPSIIFGNGIISLQQKKLQRAKEFFEKGSKMKNPRCIHYLGIMYRDGIYFEKDSEKAVELLSKAKALTKKANEPKKTTDEEDTAENLYSKGIQNKSDNIEDSIYFFELASKKGDVKSMKELYEIYYDGIQSIEYDYGKAFKYAKMGADKGNVELMRKTAEMYENGEGTDENISKAAKYYKMAADKNDVESMNKYGLMLDQGEGVKADKKKHVIIIKKLLKMVINMQCIIMH